MPRKRRIFWLSWSLLRRIFGTKREEVTGGWRRRIRWAAVRVARIVEMRNAYKILVGIFQGKVRLVWRRR
jgi:predicted dithiol-disulfide oxidoreductase (DUF899 family)